LKVTNAQRSLNIQINYSKISGSYQETTCMLMEFGNNNFQKLIFRKVLH